MIGFAQPTEADLEKLWGELLEADAAAETSEAEWLAARDAYVTAVRAFVA